jgi:hypothetical protein
VAFAARDVELDQTVIAEMFRNPEGPLRGVMERCGGIVEIGAKRRVEKRTGRSAAEIHAGPVAVDDRGLYIDVISPARAPKTGFPYPTVHEGRRVRDRRAHRSLKPALNDLKKLGFVR